MVKKIFCCLAVLSTFILNGCIGSAIFYGPEGCLDEFPNLGSVPEKPIPPNAALYKQTEEQLTNKQQEALEQNKNLRDQFNLETKTTCQ